MAEILIVGISNPLVYTLLKINIMEHNNESLVQMFFLLNWVIFRFHVTPPKFNIAPEKWWLEDEFPFGIAYF